MRIFHRESKAVELFSTELLAKLSDKKELVFFCIGTDRSTGDCFGPLLGTFLKESVERLGFEDTYVYGTLHDPVHAVNLQEHIELVQRKHPHATVIAADACLGRLKSVGFVSFSEGQIKPGAGVNKDLPAVGDYALTGVVNVSGFMEFFVLSNTRLSLIHDMAKMSAKAIERFLLARQNHSLQNII